MYFHHIKEAIITVRIFDFQALRELTMHILFYNEHQEHESQYKEKIKYTLLFVLNSLCIFDGRFQMHSMSAPIRTQRAVLYLQ